MRRWRGLKALVHEAVDATTELVRDGNESSARSVMRLLGAVEPVAETARGVDAARRLILDGVLGTIRRVNRTVETWSDAGLDAAEQLTSGGGPTKQTEGLLPLRSDLVGTWAWWGDAGLGAVNGVLGSHLRRLGNELDLGMDLRLRNAYLPREVEQLEAALRTTGGRLAVFVHGLSSTEWSWCFRGEANHGEAGASFGSLLERDLGFVPIYVRYNSGRHVSENGRELAERLDELIGALPVPLEEVVLVGHSMGGLVARSACHYAGAQGQNWQRSVTRVFSLGAPHRGAPLEKLGALATATLTAIDLPGTRIPGRILTGRSSGMKDMRYGSIVDEDWQGVDPDALGAAGASEAIPLLDRARYYFISATFTEDPHHPVGRFVGDSLVRVPSASGPRIEHHAFPLECRTYGGVLHHELQNHPAVYQQIRDACRDAGDDGSANVT